MAVVVNKPIPEFEAQATGGIKVSNQTHLGQTVILRVDDRINARYDDWEKLIREYMEKELKN